MSLTFDLWNASHLGDVARVLNAASPVDRFSLEQLRENVLDDIDVSPRLLVQARAGGQLVGAVAAVARPPRGSGASAPAGFLKLLAVAPDREGQGIGSRLLAEVESGLRALGAEKIRVFGDAPFYLRPGVDFQLTRLVCFLLDRGYQVRGHAVNMVVDLARAPLDTRDDEARLAALGIQIRRLAVAEADAFEGYLRTSWSWSWTVEAMRTLQRQPISTHLAWRGDQIIGFASHSVGGPAQFGPMGVQPEERRHGIGGVLLKRCLADLREAGHPLADIQWVGPIGFYARQVGATLSRCFWQFEKTLDR